jgi:hypothetical protein
MRKMHDKTLLRREIAERKNGDRLTTLCISKNGYWIFSPHYSKSFNPKNFEVIVDTKGFTRKMADKLISDFEKQG